MARLASAVSGGVDSAVATARMIDAGHDVVAVHFVLDGDPATRRSGLAQGASSVNVVDAQQVADRLGIPLEVWDFSTEFRQQVVDYFLGEYRAGRTPNPCLRCNATIKFGIVVDRALERGFDGVITGHYGRANRLPDGSVELYRASCLPKDQSYVLSVLSQDQLRAAWFPLGDSTKQEVRAEAEARGIPVATKPDSSDICFIPDRDTAGYLHDKLGHAPGDIVDQSGTVLGHHDGAFTFTIGQRRGLRLSRPAADGQPRYVTGLNTETNQVRVGGKDALRVDRVEATGARWTNGQPASPITCLVQMRAHGQPLPATVHISEAGDPAESTVTIDLTDPTWGIAPGQGAVFYDGDRVLGSALITGTQARESVNKG